MLGRPGCAAGGISGGIFKTAKSRAFRALFLLKPKKLFSKTTGIVLQRAGHTRGHTIVVSFSFETLGMDPTCHQCSVCHFHLVGNRTMGPQSTKTCALTTPLAQQGTWTNEWWVRQLLRSSGGKVCEFGWVTGHGFHRWEIGGTCHR